MVFVSLDYEIRNPAVPYTMNAGAVRIERTLNDIGRAEVTLPLSSTVLNNFPKNAEVEILLNGSVVFSGIITRRELSKPHGTVKLVIYEKAIKLMWTLVSVNGDYRLQYDNIPASVIAGDILNGSGFTLAECPTTYVSLRLEYAKRWKALQTLADLLGADLWVEGTAVHIGTKGTTKTLNYMGTLGKAEDVGKIANRVIILGAGDGINQAEAAAEDATSISENGLHEAAFTMRNLDDMNVGAAASQVLAVMKDAAEEVKVEAFLPDALDVEPGDYLTLNDADLGLSGTYRVKRVRISGHRASFELANREDLLSDRVNELIKNLESLGVYAQGATNLYSIQESDNADPDHPITLKIYVPPEALKINRVKLNMTVSAFRAYSKAIAGGGATTVTSSAGGGIATTTAAGGGTTITETTDAGGGYYSTKTTTSGGGVTVTSESGGSVTVTSESGGGAVKTSTAEYSGKTSKTGTSSVTLYDTTSYTATAELTYYGSTSADITLTLSDSWGASNSITQTLPPGGKMSISLTNARTSPADVTISASATTGSLSIRAVAETTHTHDVTIPSHTHDVSIPDHTHTVTIPDHDHDVTISIPSHSHDVTITLDDHTHDIEIPDHTHDITLPDHTHEIEFGIFEIDTGATVSIKVNGTTVKTGSTGETDLDITDHIVKGWNTIELTPTDLARISASVFFQVFIQSR